MFDANHAITSVVTSTYDSPTFEVEVIPASKDIKTRFRIDAWGFSLCLFLSEEQLAKLKEALA